MLAVVGLLTVSVSVVIAYVGRSRRRALRWNVRHLCGWCAAPLPLHHAFVDGHAVCPACAGAARWRLGSAGLLTLGASAVFGVGLLMPALRWWASGIPVGGWYLVTAVGLTIAPAALGLGALRRMQARNRAALAASPTTTLLPNTRSDRTAHNSHAALDETLLRRWRTSTALRLSRRLGAPVTNSVAQSRHGTLSPEPQRWVRRCKRFCQGGS